MGGILSYVWLTPFYMIVPPFILLISLPLGILAAFTTALAAVTLAFRASVVYVELVIAVIHSWLFPTKPVKKSSTRSLGSIRSSPTTTNGHGASSPVRKRRLSTKCHGSEHSLDQIRADAISGSLASTRASRSGSFASLIGAAAPDRDYEGVGGWRDLRPGTADSDVAEDDALWTGMNSRLELPISGLNMSTTSFEHIVGGTRTPGSITPGARPTRRHHVRSLTGTSQRVGFKISPFQSRARTPSAGEDDIGYFGLQPGAQGRRKSISMMMTELVGREGKGSPSATLSG